MSGLVSRGLRRLNTGLVGVCGSRVGWGAMGDWGARGLEVDGVTCGLQK